MSESGAGMCRGSMEALRLALALIMAVLLSARLHVPACHDASAEGAVVDTIAEARYDTSA